MKKFSDHQIHTTVNGVSIEADIPPRLLLTDFLRHRLGLTGTHVGCEHGVCGACTVEVDGEPVRACLMLAVQVDQREIRTIEGLASPGEPLHPAQKAMHECHGLQCGFCTSGLVMSMAGLVERPEPIDQAEVDDVLSGHLCRCTGYRNIIEAARRAIDVDEVQSQ